jgi:hypothetical protein|tara:strand:+ start:914 stop:1099 length:186 start_codon:yes stop_codon:yes gene_type:complete
LKITPSFGVCKRNKRSIVPFAFAYVRGDYLKSAHLSLSFGGKNGDKNARERKFFNNISTCG